MFTWNTSAIENTVTHFGRHITCQNTNNIIFGRRISPNKM